MATPEKPSSRAAWLRALLVLGRVALGLIFLYAAYAKLHFEGEWHLRDYHFFFAMAIDSYKILPISAVQLMARILPWFELALGGLLIAGVAVGWIGLITSGLLLVFVGAMTRAKILGLEINCGCFGNNEKLGTATLIRDSSLLVLALAVTIGAFLIKKRQDTGSS
jgi:Methylamine utilisation protein MauE